METRGHDIGFMVCFFGRIFLLSVQFTTLFLYSSVTTAVKVSTFLLRRFSRCSHGSAAAAIFLDAANGQKKDIIMFFFYCVNFSPLLYLCSVDMTVAEEMSS